jgi:hypothetical protein
MIAITALLLPLPALGQEMAVMVPQGAFAERLTDRVQVSGRYLVGLLQIPAAGLGEARGFGEGVLTMPVPEGGQVCIRATSQDGRYEAQNLFVASGGPAPWARVAWPTSHGSYLREASLRELAVLASGEPCSRRPASLVPVRIGGPGEALVVLVNARGGTIAATLRPEGSGAPLRARCGRSDGVHRLAFDVRCAFGVVPPGSYRLAVQLATIDGAGWETVESPRLTIPPTRP